MMLRAKEDGQSQQFNGGNKSLGETGSEDEASDWMAMTNQQSLYKTERKSSLAMHYNLQQFDKLTQISTPKVYR
jgi:hypothetical protein